MHSKLANPHYPPEIQAECTLINFTVTENGLEDQLLSLVVKKERPDLAATKEDLVQQQNEFKITLSNLEKGLLK
jgi:dynein heavy chain